MGKITMEDRWAIYNKLNEANKLITEQLYILEDIEDIKELINYQVEIEKMAYQLVY